MTVSLTSIVAIFIIERIDEKKGTTSIIPLVMAGIISVVYWRQAYYFICFIYTRSFAYPIMMLVNLLLGKEPDLIEFLPKETVILLKVKLIVNSVNLVVTKMGYSL